MGMNTVWWAISQSVDEPAKSHSSPPYWLEGYLDPHKRYRLGDGQLPNFEQGRVIDTQPQQPPSLETKLEALEALPEEIEPDDLIRLGLPAIALPYLTLQEWVPTVPQLYDAWQDGIRAVVLLSDRSQWTLLAHLWATEPLPPLQILHYLNEMVQLWETLAQVNCCQSLLEKTNLRVDEDQTLALQQLYPDPNTPVPLSRLAQMWQTLLIGAGSEYEFLQPFLQIAHQLETPAQWRSQLHVLAQVYQGGSGKNDDLTTVALPMVLRSLEDAGTTDVGRQRRQNEDSFGINTQVIKSETNQQRTVEGRGLYIVCDGMGGHAGGEVASAMAVETLQRYFQEHWGEAFPDQRTIQEGIWEANQTLYNINVQNARTGSARMGTTLCMALVHNTRVAIASVGDSRIYRITRKGLEQLTVDHCVGQQQVQRGVEPEIAYARPDAYQLTQALGPRNNDSVSPTIQFFTVNEDTLFLICSDGLSDNHLVNTQQDYLTSLITSKANLKQGLKKLIELANGHNGHDNLTGLFIRVKVKPKLASKRV